LIEVADFRRPFEQAFAIVFLLLTLAEFIERFDLE
jgi:hypothetical protein